MNILIFSSLKEEHSLSDFLNPDITNNKRQKEKALANKILFSSLKHFYSLPIIELPSIIKNEYGKPFFSDQNLPNFNISHSHDLLILGLSNEMIGIDLEQENTNRNMIDIAQRFYTQKQNEFININGSFDQKLFYLIWILTESLSKFIGKGFISFNKDFTILPRDNSIKINDQEYLSNINVGSVLYNQKNYQFSFVSKNTEIPDLYFFSNNEFLKINSFNHSKLNNLEIKKLDFKNYFSLNY